MKSDGIGIIEEIKTFIREPYAWPGGYPKLLLMDDGACLCDKCAKDNFREILTDTKTHSRSGWLATATFIHYEGEAIHCAHCNVAVESAYGPLTDDLG